MSALKTVDQDGQLRGSGLGRISYLYRPVLLRLVQHWEAWVREER